MRVQAQGPNGTLGRTVVESRSHLAFWGVRGSYWEHCDGRGKMSGSFSLLLARTVMLACDLYERTWARAGVRLVEL